MKCQFQDRLRFERFGERSGESLSVQMGERFVHHGMMQIYFKRSYFFRRSNLSAMTRMLLLLQKMSQTMKVKCDIFHRSR